MLYHFMKNIEDLFYNIIFKLFNDCGRALLQKGGVSSRNLNSNGLSY